MKLTVLLILTLGTAYRLALYILQHRSAGNPIPDNVADVYDEETYAQWRSYSAENCRLNMISTLAGYLASMALLCSNAHAAFASLFPLAPNWQLAAVILLEVVTGKLVSVGFRYYQIMVIEEKYGFNRTKIKTFLADRIRELIAEGFLFGTLAHMLSLLHEIWGPELPWWFAVHMSVAVLIGSFLFPIFSRMGNKFVPLEDGELKDKLQALLAEHGYRVKSIKVMDASRRTTKLNAYFAGFGRMKTIVLFDNMLNVMTTDEICAVFAHEMGHGLNRDVLKKQLVNFGNLLLIGAVAWMAVCDPGVHEAFGFDGINYGFGFILMCIGLGLTQPVTGMALNAYSRRAEYRADFQAVLDGYGAPMITALKKLARENFSHLAPSPINVILEYTHPPLSQRIAAVEENL